MLPIPVFHPTFPPKVSSVPDFLSFLQAKHPCIRKARVGTDARGTADGWVRTRNFRVSRVSLFGLGLRTVFVCFRPQASLVRAVFFFPQGLCVSAQFASPAMTFVSALPALEPAGKHASLGSQTRSSSKPSLGLKSHLLQNRGGGAALGLSRIISLF